LKLTISVELQWVLLTAAIFATEDSAPLIKSKGWVFWPRYLFYPDANAQIPSDIERLQ